MKHVLCWKVSNSSALSCHCRSAAQLFLDELFEDSSRSQFHSKPSVFKTSAKIPLPQNPIIIQCNGKMFASPPPKICARFPSPARSVYSPLKSPCEQLNATGLFEVLPKESESLNYKSNSSFGHDHLSAGNGLGMSLDNSNKSKIVL